METGAVYRVCFSEPHDEDFSCSDSLSFEPKMYGKYVNDHRFYFAYEVGYSAFSFLNHLSFNNMRYEAMRALVIPRGNISN